MGFDFFLSEVIIKEKETPYVMLKIPTLHLLCEENMIYCAKPSYCFFSALIFDKHVLGYRNSQRAEVYKLKETIYLCKIISPFPLIIPFMRHLGTLFTHC